MRRHFQKNGFLGTSHHSTLKDTSTAWPCPQKHGELKKTTKSPIFSGELYAKKNHTNQKRDGVTSQFYMTSIRCPCIVFCTFSQQILFVFYAEVCFIKT